MSHFSVVIPLYNKDRSIKTTIESVVNQTYFNFELIVVNDGSTDNSLAVAQSVQDDRIRIINKSNSGVSSARNRGIEEARYPWIAFLDGDDLWHKDYLLNIVKLIEKYPSASIFSNECTFTSLPEAYEKIFEESFHEESFFVDDFFKQANIKPFVNSSNIVIYKKCFEQIGNFDTRLIMGEDLDMWCRLGRVYKFAHSKAIMSFYISDSENRASNGKIDYTLTSVYNLDLSDVKSIYEKKYYAKRVSSELIYLLKKARFLKIAAFLLRYPQLVPYLKIIRRKHNKV